MFSSKGLTVPSVLSREKLSVKEELKLSAIMMFPIEPPPPPPPIGSDMTPGRDWASGTIYR